MQRILARQWSLNMSHIIFWLLVTFHEIEIKLMKVKDFLTFCDLEWPWDQVCWGQEHHFVIFLIITLIISQLSVLIKIKIFWPLLTSSDLYTSFLEKLMSKTQNSFFTKYCLKVNTNFFLYYRVRNPTVKFQKFSSIKMTTKP